MPSDKEFNDPEAHIILRALGPPECDFRVHKLILSLASPVFKDTFSLPQPNTPASKDSSVADVISVADPPHALGTVLRIIYPNTTASYDGNLDTLVECLIIAEKYEMKNVTSQLRHLLSRVDSPLRVYAIASRFEFTNLENSAFFDIVTTVNLPEVSPLPDDYEFVPITKYHDLVSQRARFLKAMTGVIKQKSLKTTLCSGCQGRHFTEEVFGLRLSHLILTGTPVELEPCTEAWVEAYGDNARCKESCVLKFILYALVCVKVWVDRIKESRQKRE